MAISSDQAAHRRRAAWIGTAFLVALFGCSKKAAENPPEPSAPPFQRVAVLLGEPIDGIETALLEEARAREMHLAITSSHGHVNAQIEQVGQALDAGPAALLLGPVAPDVLQRARSAARDKHVPFVALLHGDARSGSWVGVRSSALAREAGERAGRLLLARGIRQPRVFVVEDGRWPESTRRVEEMLRGLEATCGSIQLMLRVAIGLTPAETSSFLLEGLGRAHVVDVLVAGDRMATAGAELGARGSKLKESLLVVGATDDAALVETARGADSKLVVVTWKREDLVKLSIDAVEAAMAAPDAQVTKDVPCELVGPDAVPPRKDG